MQSDAASIGENKPSGAAVAELRRLRQQTDAADHRQRGSDS